jgi:predicted porin
LKIGLAYDRSKLRISIPQTLSATTSAQFAGLLPVATGTTISNRTAWALPLRYATGNHNFYLEYARARDDKATAAADGARMIALAYAYDLSRRTSVGITYARLRNDPGALYNLYNSAAGQGSASAAVAAGEDPRIWAIGMRHAF